ncbi:CMGC kinase [Fusarium beomiforme]|uniref:CMGC kinase n=1 Tax=Fusarium beomiforme TaxID=44412 RepID=A0A9P5APL2_9HYPO|nr:CMGC kinase [Fusarium beomiforme]
MSGDTTNNPPEIPQIQVNDSALEVPYPQPGLIDADMGSIPIRSGPNQPATLFNLIWENKVLHNGERQDHFWPYLLLDSLMTRQCVIQELVSTSMGREDAEKYCDKILGVNQVPHRRIFALLVTIQRHRNIREFINKNLNDDKFPLVVGSKSHQDAQSIMKNLAWEPHEIDQFNWNEPRVSVMFFALGKNNQAEHYHIPKNQMLPWMLCKEGDTGYEETKEGGFGTVTKYKIDPNSHNFTKLLNEVGLNSELVAVKSLKKPLDTKGPPSEDIKEFGMLKRYSGLNHRSIITLLATYTMNNHYNFIFPAAEYDLAQYWEAHDGPLNINNPTSAQGEELKWLSGQIRDLFAALVEIHKGKKLALETEDRYGRHGDLKPENILWFKSRKEKHGIFVITDLGIADAHRDQTRSNIPGADLPVTPSYRPPECDIRNGQISRDFDVWTMGCVILEMVCWLLGGKKNREDFKNARKSRYISGVVTDIFFDIEKPNNREGYKVRVKKGVTKWISSLHMNSGCSSYVHRLLKLVHEEMLVIDKKSRQSMAMLLQNIDEMHKRVKEDINYIKEPKPWNSKDAKLKSKSANGVHLSERLEKLLGEQEEKRRELEEESDDEEDDG